jgi:hypothetical protein
MYRAAEQSIRKLNETDAQSIKEQYTQSLNIQVHFVGTRCVHVDRVYVGQDRVQS